MSSDHDSAIIPGISLKKALFNILHERIGDGERWHLDANKQPLTVSDSDLRWKAGAPDPDAHVYSDSYIDSNAHINT